MSLSLSQHQQGCPAGTETVDTAETDSADMSRLSVHLTFLSFSVLLPVPQALRGCLGFLE